MMRNELLASVLGAESFVEPQVTTPEDAEQAGLELILRESEEDLEHANLVGSMVAELADNVAGAEALLTAPTWDGDRFAKVYNRASVLANKVNGHITNVLGGEAFGSQIDTQLAAASGMEGLASAVGDGLKKVWELLVKAVTACYDAVKGIFTSKEKSVKASTQKINTAKSKLPTGPLTIKVGPLQGHYILKDRKLNVIGHSAMTHNVLDDLLDLSEVITDQIAKGSNGSIDPIMTSIKSFYKNINGIIHQGKETEKNGDRVTYVVELGGINIEWTFMILNDIKNEDHLVEFIKAFNFRIFSSIKDLPSEFEISVGSTLVALDDANKEAERILKGYVGGVANCNNQLKSKASIVNKYDGQLSVNLLRAVINKMIELSNKHIRILSRQIDTNNKAIDYIIKCAESQKPEDTK